jgi:Phage head completion protein (GPL)
MIASGNPVLTTSTDTTGLPAPVVAEVRDLQAEIDSGPFWPRIDPGQARLEMRLDGTVNATRLRTALIEAVALVNTELDSWATQQQANGHSTLADTTHKRIDLVSLNELRYIRAVHCYAAANLAERLRNFDTTAEGHNRADAMTDPIDDHRRDARWAVSDILGRTRTVVELI